MKNKTNAIWTKHDSVSNVCYKNLEHKRNRHVLGLTFHFMIRIWTSTEDMMSFREGKGVMLEKVKCTTNPCMIKRLSIWRRGAVVQEGLKREP